MWIEWIVLAAVLAVALYFVFRHFQRQAAGRSACDTCRTCDAADTCFEILEKPESESENSSGKDG